MFSASKENVPTPCIRLAVRIDESLVRGLDVLFNSRESISIDPPV
jgi:hypothetical protein